MSNTEKQVKQMFHSVRSEFSGLVLVNRNQNTATLGFSIFGVEKPMNLDRI